MAGPYDYYGQDEQLQRYTGETQKGVSEAMMQGGGPLGRAWAGAMAWKATREKSPWLDKSTAVKQDVLSRNLSRLFRLTGRTKQAEWIDRFTATQIKKPQDAKKAQQEEDQASREAKRSGDATRKEMSTVRGSLVRIEREIGILNAAVLDTRDDVGDIKKMLMPTNLVAAGEGDRYGEQEYVQYNPLAPKGAQFLAQQTLEIDGEPVRGKLINRAPDEAFMESAIRMAAVETASTVLRIQRKDEQREERTEVRLARRARNLANDTWAYSDPTEPDREFMRKLTGEWGGKVEEVKQDDGLVEDMLEGVVGGAIGATLPGLLKSTLTKLLGIGAGGVLVPALQATLPLGLMYAFTRFAETADINNPGKNPIALIGYYGLKWSEILRGETVEEQRARREQFERDLMDRAAAGEIPLSVAQSAQAQGRRAPGAYSPWNMPDTAPTPTAEQLEIYQREAKKFRDLAANATDEATRKQHEAAAAVFESMIPKAQPTGELRPAETPENMKDLITKAANMVGMDAATMIAIARQESGFQANARPYDKDGKPVSSARGLFQFITSTWNSMKRRYGGGFPELEKGPMDPYANSLAASLLAKEHSEALLAKGIQPTPRNLYALHMMGEKKGRALLEANSDDIAADLFPNEAASNQGMFYENNRPVTVRELLDKMYNKVGAKYYSDRYQLEQRFGRDYSGAFVPQRFNGDEMDSTSREVQYAQRRESAPVTTGGGGVAVVNNTLPIRGTAPVTTTPKPPGYTSDPSILAASGRDS